MQAHTARSLLLISVAATSIPGLDAFASSVVMISQGTLTPLATTCSRSRASVNAASSTLPQFPMHLSRRSTAVSAVTASFEPADVLKRQGMVEFWQDNFAFLLLPALFSCFIALFGKAVNAFFATNTTLGMIGIAAFLSHAAMYYGSAAFFRSLDFRAERIAAGEQRLGLPMEKLQPDVIVDCKEYKRRAMVSLRTMLCVWLPSLVVLHSIVLPWRWSFGFSLAQNVSLLPNFFGLLLGLKLTFTGFHHMHNLFHSLQHVPFVRRMHAEHHSVKTPVAVGALDFHPVDSFFSLVLPAFAAPILLGASPTLSLCMFALHAMDLVIPHCGYRVPGYGIYAFHDLHHRDNTDFD